MNLALVAGCVGIMLAGGILFAVGLRYSGSLMYAGIALLLFGGLVILVYWIYYSSSILNKSEITDSNDTPYNWLNYNDGDGIKNQMEEISKGQPTFYDPSLLN
jgi:hypothetical protein